MQRAVQIMGIDIGMETLAVMRVGVGLFSCTACFDKVVAPVQQEGVMRIGFQPVQGGGKVWCQVLRLLRQPAEGIFPLLEFFIGDLAQ